MVSLPKWLRNKILKRRQAYATLFFGDNGEIRRDAEVVLKDLARFCRAHKSTAVYSMVRGAMDPVASARADGRREVWLRIIENLHLDDRFLTNLREGADDND